MIYHNVNKAEVKIRDISDATSAFSGGEKKIIVCDKLDAADLQLVFYDEHSGWSGLGVFGPGDVHHRCCVVFRTPSYPSHGLGTTVKLMLRKCDRSFSSQPIDFMYYPDREFEGEHRKHPEKSYMKKTPRHTQNLTESTLSNPSTTQPSATISFPTYTYQDIPTNTQL